MVNHNFLPLKFDALSHIEKQMHPICSFSEKLGFSLVSVWSRFATETIEDLLVIVL